MNTHPLTPSLEVSMAGARLPMLRPGRGLHLSAGLAGTAYSAAGGGARWPHAWKPALGASGVSFSRGLLNAKYEPTIEGKPISSGVLLQLDANVANEQGESWAAVEFKPTAGGSIDETTVVTLVHTAAGISGDPQLARYHIALFLWRQGRPFLVHEIAHFDLLYKRITRADERPAWHWFG